MKDLSKLPATQEYLDNFKAKTLDIVLKGTSASLSFLPRSGTNGLLNYLLSYQSRLLKTTKVIFLELQENDSYSPIEQITTHLSVQESPKPRILEQLRLECQKGVNFVFVVGNFHLTKTNNNLKLELVELFKLNNAFIKFLLLFPCEMDIYSRRALTGLLGCNVHSYSNLRRLEDINLLVENDKD